MAIYVRIVDHGGMSAAARALNLSVPTVVRALAGLESMLGVRLVNRTTRRMNVTDEGRLFYERSVRVLADVADAEASVGDRAGPARGRLVVTASVPFGRRHVAPLLSDFLAAHPHVTAELILDDRVLDLVAEGVGRRRQAGRHG